MKFAVLMSLFSLFLFAQEGALPSFVPFVKESIIPYGGDVKYSDSSKEEGWFAGVYYQREIDRGRFEMNLEHTEIVYTDRSEEDLKLTNLTAVWTHYKGENNLFRYGGHYIDSNEAQSDRVLILIAGIKYYEGYDFDIGVDLFYSIYSKFAFDTNTTITDRGASFSNAPGTRMRTNRGLEVFQAEGSVGFVSGEEDDILGPFYTRLYLDLITPLTDNGMLLKDAYHSAGFTLRKVSGAWMAEMGGWIGEQVFGVRNGGFTVYNLPSEHRGGMNAAVHYSFIQSLGLRVGYIYERFKESGFEHAASHSVLGSVDYSF